MIRATAGSLRTGVLCRAQNRWCAKVGDSSTAGVDVSGICTGAGSPRSTKCVVLVSSQPLRSRAMTERAPVAVPLSRLPEQIERYGVDLHRWQPAEAAALHAAIVANVDHLRPYMHWIAFEPQTLEQRGELVESWAAQWASGGDLSVGIWRAGHLVGSAGLHRRLGPDGLAIGYWVARDHLNQGIATAASRALTDLAFTVPGVDRVQISHDAGNLASARVPAKLGYHRLPDRAAVAEQGPAGTGVEGLWVITKTEWL